MTEQYNYSKYTTKSVSLIAPGDTVKSFHKLYSSSKHLIQTHSSLIKLNT